MLTAPSSLSLKVKRLTTFVSLIMTIALLLSFGPMRGTLACSAPPPMPLRLLYIGSERVVHARAGQSAVIKSEKLEEYNGYQRTLLRTSFYVSRTYKGKGEEDEEVVHVYRWLWGEDKGVPEDFAEGTNLLLFLNHSEEAEAGYEIYDERFGAKKLSDDDLKVYSNRIEELEKILRDKKPDKRAIVEWLVRCAEEPATRWEGAYELSMSQDFLDRALEADSGKADESGEAAAEADESPETPAPESDQRVAESSGSSTESEVPSSVEEEESDPYNPTFARLLTSDHKNRLANTFFGLQTLSGDDLTLMQLVQSFDDERMVPFVLAQLGKVRQDPPYYVEGMLTFLAEKLGDEKLIALAEKYSERADYRDPEQQQEGEEEEEEEVDEEEKALTGNSTQKRSARLQKFLVEVESVMVNQIALARQEEK